MKYRRVSFIWENSEDKPVWNGKLFKTTEENWVEIGNNEHDLTPDIQSAISSPKYNKNNINDDYILTFIDIPESDIFNINNSKPGENEAVRMKSATKYLPQRSKKILNRSIILPNTKNEAVPDPLIGEGVKIIIIFNIIVIWTKSKTLIGWKLFGNTVTLTKSGNLVDDLYKRCEIQNELQYWNALEKFYTNWKNGTTK